MSRLGKIPVAVPAGVQVRIDGRKIEVKGAKGTLSRELPAEIKADVKEGRVHVTPNGDADNVSALWGLNRMLVENMIIGVSAGYKKELDSYKVENTTRIIIEGIDKEMVGQTASEIRKIRKPEPYKGKGIKYVGEFIRRKAGKVAGK